MQKPSQSLKLPKAVVLGMAAVTMGEIMGEPWRTHLTVFSPTDLFSFLFVCPKSIAAPPFTLELSIVSVCLSWCQNVSNVIPFIQGPFALLSGIYRGFYTTF